MLKHFLMTFLLGLSFSLFSQSQDYVKAKVAHDQKDYVKAQEHIEKAVDFEKTAKKSRTWILRGDIYRQIAQSSAPEVQAISENAASLAFESYQKAVSMDSKVKKSQVENNCSILSSYSLTQGVAFFNNMQYGDAKNSFELCVNIADWLGKTDSLVIFNLAMTCQHVKDYPCAIESYGRCVKLNYRQESSYESLGYCLQMMGDFDGAKVMLLEGIGRYPDNHSMQTSLLNIFLRSGEGEKALAVVDNLLKADPDNPSYYSVKGSVLIDLDRTEEAIPVLEHGLKLDPESFGMSFNLGSLSFNKAVDIMIAANNESDFEKSEELSQKAIAEFEMAKKHLENAHAINPDDVGTMDGLRNIYTYTGDEKKFEEMNKKLRK